MTLQLSTKALTSRHSMGTHRVFIFRISLDRVHAPVIGKVLLKKLQDRATFSISILVVCTYLFWIHRWTHCVIWWRGGMAPYSKKGNRFPSTLANLFSCFSAFVVPCYKLWHCCCCCRAQLSSRCERRRAMCATQNSWTVFWRSIRFYLHAHFG